jgi:hypothetical protein
MAKYTFQVARTEVRVYEGLKVEADTEEEAHDLAEQIASGTDFNQFTTDDVNYATTLVAVKKNSIDELFDRLEDCIAVIWGGELSFANVEEDSILWLFDGELQVLKSELASVEDLDSDYIKIHFKNGEDKLVQILEVEKSSDD